MSNPTPIRSALDAQRVVEQAAAALGWLTTAGHTVSHLQRLIDDDRRGRKAGDDSEERPGGVLAARRLRRVGTPDFRRRHGT